jgi:hypothetical protein
LPFDMDVRDGGRDSSGRFARGNTAALVAGARSEAFWRLAEAERAEIVASVLAAKGFREADAPVALRTLATGLAQAKLLRDSAFERVVESGGPLAASGRVRAAFGVWKTASDSALRHAASVDGFKSAGDEHDPTIVDYLQQRREAEQ